MLSFLTRRNKRSIFSKRGSLPSEENHSVLQVGQRVHR